MLKWKEGCEAGNITKGPLSVHLSVRQYNPLPLVLNMIAISTTYDHK